MQSTVPGVKVAPMFFSRSASPVQDGSRPLGSDRDGTAGAGLPAGSRTRLGGQAIMVTDRGARLDDGTLAGSVITMDRAFGVLTRDVGLTVVDAVRLLATTPAEQLGLVGQGVIRQGAVADLVVLTPAGEVRQTFVAGQPMLEQ